MKRMHLKRALSLILALVMVFACLAFTACDDADGGQTNDEGTNDGGQTNGGGQTNDEGTNDEGTSDEGGEDKEPAESLTVAKAEIDTKGRIVVTLSDGTVLPPAEIADDEGGEDKEPTQGLTVAKAEIDANERIVITLSNGTVLPPAEITNIEILVAMKDAEAAYAAYKTAHGGEANAFILYKTDTLFVPLQNGAAIGAYADRAAALNALMDDPSTLDDESLAYVAAITETEGIYSVIEGQAGEKVIDLVLFMGQSNMVGNGGTASEAPVVPEGHGYWFKCISAANGIYPLEEPFGAGEVNSALGSNGTRGSMVSAFANAYYDNTGVPIVGVFAAQGNTGIDFWLPGGDAFEEVVSRYQKAKIWLQGNGYTIRNDYMVWCQGETDGENKVSKDDYKSKFFSVVDELVATGIDACFVVRIGHNTTNPAKYDDIILAQTEICKEYEDIVMVCTATASFIEDGLMYDYVHYSQAGYNKAGTLAGEHAAYFVNTGKKPTMEDPKYGNIYDPYN